MLCFTSVVCGLLHAFFSPLLVFSFPVVSLHTSLLVYGGDDLAAIQARTYGHSFLSLCVGGWAKAFIRCHLLLLFLAGAVFIALFVAAHFGVAWHVTSLYCVCYGVMHGDMLDGDMHGVAYNINVLRRPVALLLLVCVIHA